MKTSVKFLITALTMTFFVVFPAVAGGSLPLGADGEITEEMVSDAVCGYMLGNNDLTLDEVSDAAYVYKVWNGKPHTVTDMDGRTMTFYRPIERIITTNPDNSRLVIAYGNGDLLVGSDECTVGSRCVCPMTTGDEIYYEECWESCTDGGLNNVPQTSTRYEVNYELMTSLQPDIIFEAEFWKDRAEDMAEKTGAPVFVSGCDFEYSTMKNHFVSVGDALSKEKEAEELVSFMDKKINMITSITDNIPEDEKPTVYFAPRGAKKGFYDAKEGRDFTRTVNTYDALTMAGGINVAEECADGDVNVAIEQIIAWDPDVILVACSDPEDAGLQFIIDSPELQSIKAIKEGKVYNVFYPNCRGRPTDINLINLIYIAKILYPDRFADIDIEAEGNEIEKAFLGTDGVYTAYSEYLKFPVEQEI